MIKKIILNLDIGKDECYTRRQKTTTVDEEYFHSILWPSFIKYNKPLLLGRKEINQERLKINQQVLNASKLLPNWKDYSKCKDWVEKVQIYDGERPKEEIYEHFSQYIKKNFNLDV